MAINQKILAWARKKIGDKVGDGECWTYVEKAVTKSGGKSSKTLTENFGDKSDYVWGSEVSLTAVKPGDLLQFQSYRWDSKSIIKVTFEDVILTLPTGGFNERGQPNHSAIVNRVLEGGLVEVLEQNIEPDFKVAKSILRLTPLHLQKRTTKDKRRHPDTNKLVPVTIETTMNEIVAGKVKAYRAKI